MSKYHVFTAIIQRFEKKGEKTGWTYVSVDSELANRINPGVKTSYRVSCEIKEKKDLDFTLLPMGGGDFIFPIRKEMLKSLSLKIGDKVQISISYNKEKYKIDEDFMDYLNKMPKAIKYFESLPISHKNYFSKWIQSAKTLETKAKRIERAVRYLNQSKGYVEMIRDKE